jgi:uncharacterized protein YkwD
VEELEPRLVPSSGLQPSALDQVFLERLNAARANPAAYGASIGVNLSSVAASEPLAFDPTLIAVATAHSQDMSDNNYFSHVNLQGQDLAGRLTAAGFPWTTYGESIAAGFATPEAALNGLITDYGEPSLGHRLQLLSIGSLYQGIGEVGIGIVVNGRGQYVNYFTIDTSETANTNPFLTGVVYNDLNHNGVYDAGEGLAGVTIAVQGGPTITDWNSGGYSLQLRPGTYTVTFSGGGLPNAITRTVTLGTQNVELDITPATASQSSPPPATTTPAPQPAGPDYQSWVTQVGQDVLHRALTPAEVSQWVGYLKQGGSADAVVSALASGPEYAQLQQTNWVARTGQALLHRSLSTSEVASWQAYLQGGGTQAGFVTSLMTAAGDDGLSVGDWMNQLSQGLLGRSLSNQELTAWVNYLQHGGSKQTAALTFLNSGAYQQVQLADWLQQSALDILGRPLSAMELSAWETYLQNGGSRTTALATFVRAAGFTSQYLHG